MCAPLELLYYPLAGRAELSRLISAVGGLKVNERVPGFFQTLGMFGTQPVLKHGKLKIAQSGAIEQYLAALSPNLQHLTPKQRAVDNMFAATKAEIFNEVVPLLSGSARNAAEQVPRIYRHWLFPLEKMVPTFGFVNGLDQPTVADLVLLDLTESRLPFKKALELSDKIDMQTMFPNILSNVKRTRDHPTVSKYVSASPTIHQDYGMSFMLRLCVDTAKEQFFRQPAFADWKPAASAASIDLPKNEELELLYFPFAGRGELCRLIAAVGGIQLKHSFPGEGWHKWQEKVGMFGTMPVLRHGAFKLAQACAVEGYLAAIAPTFQTLTIEHRAIDSMFAWTKDEVIAALNKIVLGGLSNDLNSSKHIEQIFDRFLGSLEELVPTSGYVNGLSFPTVADLVLLNITEARVPFGVAFQHVPDYDWQKKFPKIKAIVELTKKEASIHSYLATSSTIHSDL